MIRTEFGSVGLRRKRDPKTIKVSKDATSAPPTDMTIKAGWLKKFEQSVYHKTVKQAMLIASTQVELEDLSMNTIDPQTNTWRTPEVVMRKRQELSKKIEQMEQGTGMVAPRQLTVRENLGKQVMRLKKHVLTKRSAKCACSRTRWFTIENGRLNVYKNDGQHAKIRKKYELSKAKFTYEWSKMPNNPSGEGFLSGKEYRICLQCTERPQGPMYLYPDEVDPVKAAKQVKNWERACKMSKYLQSAGDKEALSMVVRHVTGNVMAKGWVCLFNYSAEIQSTKRTVKTFAMRLMKVDYSRGWNKFKLTYEKRKNAIQLKAQQQEYAAKFLAQRMQSINATSAGRPLQAVRKQMVSTIQAKFRHYRQEKIFDRVYALGSQSCSRIQQAKKGSVMDMAFTSQSWKEALLMTLTGDGEKELRGNESTFKSHKSSYSEINLGVHRGHVNVSDSLTMLSFSEVEEGAEHAQLAKSDWANFVNLDQISSVVLHSERQMGKKGDGPPDLSPDACTGVWFQINGPRVCWNKRVHTYPDHENPREMISEVLGAADGLEVPRNLAGGKPCFQLIVDVAVQGSSIPKVPRWNKKDGKQEPNKDRGAQLETYMVLNMLGRQYVSDHQFGPTPKYSGAFRAEVPVAMEDGTAAALSSFDQQQVSIDIMDVGNDGVDVCIWSGKMPLWKVFCPAKMSEGLMSGVKHLQASLNAMKQGADPEQLEMLIPLSKTLSSGSGAARSKIPLYHATDTVGDQWNAAHVELSFNARVEKSSPPKWCVSPELQGCGLVTALYSSQRGSWFNPRPDLKGKFSSDNVPSFVELKLKELVFPEEETEPETGKLYQYYLEVKCNGVTVSSDPVTRPKKTWAAFIRAPETKISFGEKRLYLPVPPGGFCREGGAKLEMAVYRSPIKDLAPVTFKELMASKDRAARSNDWGVKVYHCNFTLDNMQADQVKSSGTFINMTEASALPAEASFDERGDAQKAGVLECSLVLRDRDYVRMCMTENGERKLALCVGDNAMLQCDEPLRYAKDELEFRRRFFPDSFDQAKSRAGTKSLKLRDPCMSHEWHNSGLLKNERPETVKQRNIPAMAEDVIPHRFVLPSSELEFNRMGFPGSFPRIMESLVDSTTKPPEGKAAATTSSKKAGTTVVNELSHVIKSVPVNILAVYVNGAMAGGSSFATCDVEISPAFMFEWENHPDRAYSVPGSVTIREFQDASDAHVRAAPPGSGDVGQRLRRRVVLKDVPLSSLKAVHSASFNIYDARFKTIEDALTLPPNGMKNDFNPRASGETTQFMGPAGEKRGGFCIGAGPVPADALSCTYEWQLSVRAENEAEVYHFLTMLRQCVRMDFFQQALKMSEFKSRTSNKNNMRYQVGVPMTMQSGYLEIVLTEARSLIPTIVQKPKTTHKIKTLVTPELNPYVVFKLKNRGEPVPWDAEKHLPIKNAEVYRLQFDGTHGDKNVHSEDISVDLRDKVGDMVLHFAVIYKDQVFEKVRLNDWRASKKDGESRGWGADQSRYARDLPRNLFEYEKPATIDFEKSPVGWQISVNGKHIELLDFAHRNNPPLEVTKIEVHTGWADGSHKKELFFPRVDLVVRGSKTQQSPALDGTSSPNWSVLDQCAASGGWLFKTPPIDPSMMPGLVMELEVFSNDIKRKVTRSPVGLVRVPVTGDIAAEVGAPRKNLCDAQRPFNNFWLPLSTETASGTLVPNKSGELHIMTRWVANQQNQVQKRQPKTARKYFRELLKPKLLAASVREPVYDLQMRCTYNPNIARETHPLTRAALIGQHAEQLFNTEAYLDCCERRQVESWDQYLASLPAEYKTPEGILLAKRRQDIEREYSLVHIVNVTGLTGVSNAVSNAPWDERLFDLEDNLRRGFPAAYRFGQKMLWYSITNAHACIPADQKKRLNDYKALLRNSTAFKADAMLQLQEDLVTAGSWESSPYPMVLDAHLQRLKMAKNVCSALITYSYDPNPQSPQTKDPAPNVCDKDNVGGGVAYCESLLVIAFFMLLPQVAVGQEDKSAKPGTNQPVNRVDCDDIKDYDSKIAPRSSTSSGLARSNTGSLQLQRREEEERDEANVFWLLYTLIAAPPFRNGKGNGALKHYFGAGKKESSAAGSGPPLATFEGASDDVSHLNSCIARYDRELWVHITGLGFHLSSFFHGAFMRLFAFCMPTATVYRFWDLLFSESTRFENPDPEAKALAAKSDGGLFSQMMGTAAEWVEDPATTNPKSLYPRHSLIDLAYGGLMECRGALLKCESAREVRECIVSYFEALYDPSKMIEITTEAERSLWEQMHTQSLRVEPQHLGDYKMNSFYYKAFLKQFQDQNSWMRFLTQEIQISNAGAQQNNSGPKGPNAQPMQGQQALLDARMTTRNVVAQIIYPLRSLLVPQDEGKQFGGMFRKTNDRICELGPQVDPSSLGTVKYIMWTHFGQQVENVAHQIHHEQTRIAASMPVLPNTMGEPTQLTKNEWTRQVGRAMGQAWFNNDCASKIYDEFESPTERRMSLNEFFVALICCCKGTVGEKALALFHLHSYYTIPTKLNHLVPVVQNTKAVVEKVEGSQEREKGASFAPPEEEDVPKTTALHFKIMCHTQGDEMLLGEVFINNLHPYLWAGMDKDVPQAHTIWGTKMRLPPGVMMSQAMKNDPSKIRPYIGDLNLGLKWMPVADPNTPEIGQIGIHIHSIRFDPNRVEAPQYKNPFVTVCTYGEDGQKVEIPRWDPRNALRKVANVASLGVAYNGAFNSHILFEESMKRDALGMLHYRWGQSNHGWKKGAVIPDSNPKAMSPGIWQWNEKWGDQYSTENFKFKKEFVGVSAALKPNTISLQACRQITLAILRRNLYYISNRQAMLVADVAFNRAGMVPGILDAILMKGGPSQDYKTPSQLKEAYAKQGKHAHDVKHQIIIELEKQTNRHMGNINLWDPRFGDSERKNLSDLQISDPYPFSQKTLWIRYCRAGDGERNQVQITVDGSGYFQPQCIELDMDLSNPDRSVQAQMTLSKEEFVSCILANPMLSESLRQLSSRDFSTKSLPQWQPIKLQVTISDPAQSQEDDDLFDVLNVRQSVLLEVWDWDMGTKDDFLGECWLPPLGSIGPAPRQFVRTLTEASSDLGGTRPDPKKKINLKVTGEITFWASWKLPAEEVPPEVPNESLEARVKREEMLHTGKLYIKIVKAEGLRVADVRRKHGSDPYVNVYVKNDCYDSGDAMAWRKNQVTGLHDAIFQTKAQKKTISPEWNEEKTVTLMTGAFERRTRKKYQFHVTKRGKQEAIDKYALDVIKDQDELTISFGEDETKQMHDIDIFMGDTIRDFKTKLLTACQQKAFRLEKTGRPEDKEQAAKLRLVAMTFKHAVTCFTPSERLRSLAQQRREQSAEYSRLYHVEHNDPSSWQPLDPMCTFHHYAALHGFGARDAPQRVRISEGTEDYKLRNHRFRAFEENRVENAKRIEDRNTERECFGFAAYTHAMDGNSREWRAVMVDRPEGAASESGQYNVNWVFNPKFGASVAAIAAGAEDIGQKVYEQDLLLAPMNPKILGSGSNEHQELLAQAADLFKSGKSEKEIADILNSKLNAKFQSAMAAAASEEDKEKAKAKPEETQKKSEVPPPITEQEVRHHLEVLRGEEKADGQSIGGQTPATTPRGGGEADRELTDQGRPAVSSGGPPQQSYAPPSRGPAPGPSGPSMGGGPSGPGPSQTGPSGPSMSGPSGPSRTGPSVGAQFGGGGPQRG